MNNPIIKLLNELERVGELNTDNFDVFVELTLSNGKVVYALHAEESAEQHLFVSGNGHDLESAAVRALDQIPEACRVWGYKL